jgi:hypothetical protein
MSFSTKYNVLFMRDTSTVLRFRLNSLWLQLGLCGVVLLLLLALGGAYAAVSYRTESRDIKRERVALLERIGEMEQHLHRLENVESILSSVDREELNFLSSTVNLNRSLHMVLPLDLKELFSITDMNMVSVNNIQARFMGDGMRVSYDLNNLQSSGTVAGTVRFAIVTREGITLDITEPGQESPFEISRFKPATSSLTLPQGLDKEDVFALRMRITDPEGNLILSETYPLVHILS